VIGPVIVDTNVVVAGLLTSDEASPVVRILDGMLAGAFPFVVSEALLAEYHRLLMRPRISRFHGLSLLQVETILTDIAQHAIVLAPVGAAAAPDPGDQLLWDLLAARADLILVTGDNLLQQDATMHSRISSPRAFLAGESPELS
jgi:uncharacterized protein